MDFESTDVLQEARTQFIQATDEDTTFKAGIRPLWRILVFLLVCTVLMIVSATIVCATDTTCISQVPTLDTLLDNNKTSAFVVTAIWFAIAVHYITTRGLLHRTLPASTGLAYAQNGVALVMYVCFILSLYVAPHAGWDRDWTNIATLISSCIWMFFVMMCLRAVHRQKVVRRRLYRLSWIVFGFYAPTVLVFVILRAIPIERAPTKAVGILVAEIAFGLLALIFMGLLILHIRRVRLTLFVQKDERHMPLF